MVRWLLGLGCLGAGTLLALEALYTIKTQKKKRKKKKKGKRVEIYFYFVFFLILFGACSYLQAGLAKIFIFHFI